MGLTQPVKDRLEKLKTIPQEPLWRVIERLLDSWDVSHPKDASAASPAQGVPA